MPLPLDSIDSKNSTKESSSIDIRNWDRKIYLKKSVELIEKTRNLYPIMPQVSQERLEKYEDDWESSWTTIKQK